jgi:two-component system NtrC family sensor kinase
MDSHYYHSLYRSMIGTVVFVSLLPLLVITLLAGYQFATAYKGKVLDHLREIVQKHEQVINNYLDEKVAEVRVLTDTLEAPRFMEENRLRQLHEALVRRHGGDFVDLGLVSTQGRLVAYSGPFRLGKADYSSSGWFREVMERKVYISDVFLGLRGVPHFIIAVRFASEGKDWILRTTLDFVSFNQLVEDIRLGKTGQAFIVNQKGDFQTTPKSDLKTELPIVRDILEDAAPANALSSTPRVRTTITERPSTGRDTIFVTSPLKNGEWTLIYQQDAADAFSELYTIRWVGLLVLSLGAIGITIMAFILSRRMVTRIRQADMSKEMMNEQVIEAGKLASVGELAAGIAHEINNPVAIMMEEAGWIQDLMGEGLEVDDNMDEARRALLQIKTQGARCRDITHKLLSFARKIDPTVKCVNMNELVEEIASLSEQRAKYANVHIGVVLGENIPDIPASPSEMQQVVLNLVNNSIDAMAGKGGDLTMSTRNANGVVELVISDTGMGIPRANLNRIFDPFFTTKPVGKGTGLGLSIVYGIINKMGGDIKVTSSIDLGTSFTIKLPVPDKAAGATDHAEE